METEVGASVGDVSTLDDRSDQRSAMSAGRLNVSTISMRAKAKRRREASAQHNSNFRAGYVPVDEDVLQRVGIRGRKGYFLYCILVLFTTVTLSNVLVTGWLIYILGLTHNGLTSIEIVDIGGRDFLRVFADANIVTMLFSEKATLGARHNTRLSLGNSKSDIKLQDSTGSAVYLDQDSLTFSADHISVYSSKLGTKTPVSVQAIVEHGGVSNLAIANATTRKVESLPEYKDLYLESTSHEVIIQANSDVTLSSQKGIYVSQNMSDVVLETRGDMAMDGNSGVFVNPNLLESSTSARLNHSIASYKICVCDSGQIFKVLETNYGSSCDVGDELYSLCSL